MSDATLQLVPHATALDADAPRVSGCPFHRAAALFRSAPAEAASRRVPRVPGQPLLGNMTRLLADPLAFFLDSYQRVGPVFRVVAPTRSYTVMAGMDATRFLLREDGRLLDHTPLYKTVAGELKATHYPISTNGERHRHLRKKLRPAFGAEYLARSARSIAGAIGQRVRDADSRTPEVALNLMHELIGQHVVGALGGRALGGLLPHALRFARFSIGSGLGAYPAGFRFSPAYRWSRWRMRAFFRDLIAEHRRQDAEREHDFIDDVLALRDEHGEPLSEDNIIAIVQLAYSNSVLYVAPTAAFLLHDLLSNPDALAKCRAEIDAAFASGQPLVEALSACTYFEAAKTESMRINPIGLAAPRVATEDFTFAGCQLKKGETVLIATAAAHYFPENYPDPYRFEPERHLSPRFEYRQAGAYAPLGIGMHSCLAKRLVDAMVLLLVGTILHHADLELPAPGHVLRKRVNPFSEPTADFTLRLRPRGQGVPGLVL